MSSMKSGKKKGGRGLGWGHDLFERARSLTKLRHTSVDAEGKECVVEIALDTTSPEEAERRATSAARAIESEAWRRAAAFLRLWGGEMRRAESAGRAAIAAMDAGDVPGAFRRAAEAVEIERRYGGVAWTTLKEALDEALADAQKKAAAILGTRAVRLPNGTVMQVAGDIAAKAKPHELAAMAQAMHDDCPICRGDRKAVPGEVVAFPREHLERRATTILREWN